MNVFEFNYSFWGLVLLINIGFIIILSLILMFINNDDKIISFLLKLGISVIMIPILFFTTKLFMKIDFLNFLKYLWIPTFLYIFLSLFQATFLNKRGKKNKNTKNYIKKTPYKFELQIQGGKNMYFTEPFDNFLIYGGANSGKTKSLGRPLAYEFIRHRFAGFFFDYKDKDYTKFVYHANQLQDENVRLPFYYLNFVDVEYSYRTNIIKNSVISNHAELMQIINDFFVAFKSKDGKEDEWFGSALGILKGVATRFFYDYPDLLTIPHILLFCLNNDALGIASFCMKRQEASVYAQALISAIESPKTMGSFMSSLQRPIADFASNKKLCYILSGDDFDYNLIDPEDPKLFAVSNAYQIESLIAPVISAMVSISSRKFTMQNKIDFVYFLDEATTFNISNFENMPSVLREYRTAFVFITQSNSKVEKRYDRLDRSSIESNFANQFLGRTKDVKATKDYVQMFSKIEELQESYTRGESSRSNSKSTTESYRDKDKYYQDYFGKLAPGTFLGSANNSNYQEFELQFKMFSLPDIENKELPKVRTVSDWDIDNNYIKIIDEVRSLS